MRLVPRHPVDNLTRLDKCRIYYGRIVDLAVACGLLVPDPDTEIGHFAFSDYYYKGKKLDRTLMKEIEEFERQYPEPAFHRAEELNENLFGAIKRFNDQSDDAKIKDLIIIGATYCVWPTGTAFTLTYPWNLEGRGIPVNFREDLSEFTKRRIKNVLKKAGKLRNPHLFD